jgi:cytochrome oxidase Cu insertion factor (SCO1/SenC/PrrC family)
MAAAQANPNADPILAQAIAGSTVPLNFPAARFQLTDQHGQTVTLASLRGKVVLLTFLGPACPAGCRLITRELRGALALLGRASRGVALVAVVTGPARVADTQAFDRREQLNKVPGWLYLTGGLPALRRLWAAYGMAGQAGPAGSAAGQAQVAWLIDRTGQVREELNISPGPGTAASQSSFAVLLAGAARRFLR